MRTQRGPEVSLGHRECQPLSDRNRDQLPVLGTRQQWSQSLPQSDWAKGEETPSEKCHRIWGEEKGILGKPKAAVVRITETNSEASRESFECQATVWFCKWVACGGQVEAGRDGVKGKRLWPGVGLETQPSRASILFPERAVLAHTPLLPVGPGLSPFKKSPSINIQT